MNIEVIISHKKCCYSCEESIVRQINLTEFPQQEKKKKKKEEKKKKKETTRLGSQSIMN